MAGFPPPDDQVRRRQPDVEALTRNLNQAQLRAVTTPSSPLRVLAGAGSGKTRVLTHRIAYRAHENTLDPSRVLAVTFTRKAATELRSRLGGLGLRDGVTSGTFHSIAFAQLRQRWEERGVRPPELLDRKVGFVSRLMSAKQRPFAIDVVGEIEWARARMIDPEQYEREAARAHRSASLDAGAIAVIYEKYLTEKQRKRVVDFDDLLRLAVRDLEADPVYAAAQRWRFRHLFIDEFQDVNPLQFRLVKAWLGPESDFCAVGDPNQAIYAWNGADARYMTDFESYFPGAETVVLDQNYRSTPQILAVANSVLHDGGGGNAIRLKSQQRDGPVPVVASHEDATKEAVSIAREIRDRHGQGKAWSRQAVLVRTNAQALVIVEEFKRSGIPHAVRGAGSLLSEPEIKNALRALRQAPTLEMGLADIEDSVRSDDYPTATDPSGDTTDPSQVVIADQQGSDKDRTTQDQQARTRISSASPGASLSEDRIANLLELVRLGHEYLRLDPTGGFLGFNSWLRSTLQGDDRTLGDVVEVMSFHAAKGLEWPVVHLAGLEEGYVPIHHAKDLPESIAEERRLLYVAMTRAREELRCNWAQSREFGSRSLKRKPSPWLDPILATTQTAAPVLKGKAAAERARRAREAIRTKSGGTGRSATRSTGRDRASMSPKERIESLGNDRALFDSLRRWRKEQADGADVPAFVVFSDETLIELATKRPSSVDDLLKVKGIGPVKAHRYADELLAIISEA